MDNFEMRLAEIVRNLPTNEATEILTRPVAEQEKLVALLEKGRRERHREVPKSGRRWKAPRPERSEEWRLS